MNLALKEGALGKLTGWLPVLLRVVAVVWAAWVLAGLVWLAAGHDRAALPAMSQAASPQALQAPRIDTSRLASLDLFGPAVVANAPDAGSNAPDTTLQLKLNGVFVSADPDLSSAIVSESSTPAGKLYRVNDSLPGGASLEAVYEDRILLKRGAGASEVLRFVKTSLLSGGAPPPSAMTPPALNMGDIRGMLDQAAMALGSNPGGYLQSLGLVQTGNGYIVGPNAPPDMVRSSGLKPGDRIVSVNGQPLGDVNRDRFLLLETKKRGQARIEIQRGAQTLTIDQKF